VSSEASRDQGGTASGPADGQRLFQRGPQAIARDDAFDILQNRRRRFTLHYLKQAGEATLSDLAEQVAAWEHEKHSAAVTADERRATYTALQQRHLPRLDDLGVVEFDSGTGTVTLTDRAAALDIYLDVVDGYDVPWSVYYLGLAVVSGLFASLAWVGVPPFAAVSFAGWTAFVVVALTVSSTVHLLQARGMRLGADTEPPEVQR